MSDTDPQAAVSTDDKTYGMLCHLLSFCGYLVPVLGSILGPLAIWLAKRKESAFVDAHGRESLNFQLSLLIWMLLCIPLCFILIGFLLLLALGIFALVVVIIAAIRANDGKLYRYPLTIRFL